MITPATVTKQLNYVNEVNTDEMTDCEFISVKTNILSYYFYLYLNGIEGW